MRRIDGLLSKYGDNHQNKFNKLIHWFGVTMIFFSIVGLLWAVPFPLETSAFVNWATLTMVPVAAYYLYLSPRLAMGMILQLAVFSVLTHLLATRVSTPLWMISAVIFVIASVLQFIGHMVEGQKPAFLADLRALLIGPAWLMHFVYQRVGLRY